MIRSLFTRAGVHLCVNKYVRLMRLQRYAHLQH